MEATATQRKRFEVVSDSARAGAGIHLMVPDPGLDLRHLRYFIAVAEALHFGKAAKALNMSQPPLSRQIRDLEDCIGVPLLDRQAKHVALTEAGVTFLKEAHRVLNGVSRAIQMANRAAAGELGHLSLAFTALFPRQLLQRVRQEFTVREPGIHLAMHRVDSDEQARMIRAGFVDAGLLMLPVLEPDQLIIEPLIRQPAAALVTRDHPLANRSSITLEELACFPVASVRTPNGTDHAGRIATMCGVALMPGHSCTSFEELMQAVELGGAAGLAPVSAASLCGPNIHAVMIEDRCADFTFALAYSREQAPGTLTRFLHVARRINQPAAA